MTSVARASIRSVVEKDIPANNLFTMFAHGATLPAWIGAEIAERFEAWARGEFEYLGVHAEVDVPRRIHGRIATVTIQTEGCAMVDSTDLHALRERRADEVSQLIASLKRDGVQIV